MGGVTDLCGEVSGFTEEKGDPNYLLDAIRDFWRETGMDTDTEELRWIVNWFDQRRVKGPKWEKKCWGSVYHEFYSTDVGLSRLNLDPGFRCSLHFHNDRVNHFIVTDGGICIEWWPAGFGKPKQMQILSKGDSLSIDAPIRHRFRTMAGGQIIEVYWPQPGDPFAEVRFLDIFRHDEGGPDDLDELERELEEHEA